MMWLKLSLIFLLCVAGNSLPAPGLGSVVQKLDKTLDFVNSYYDHFNFDGILGITLAQAQLQLSLRNHDLDRSTKKLTLHLIQKCRRIRMKSWPNLPNIPPYMIEFRNVLMNVSNWVNYKNKRFTAHQLQDLGIYSTWTIDYIRNNKKAEYEGIPSDECLREIIELSTTGIICYASPICYDMMLDQDRVDEGYLLSHRLLYLQTIATKQCTFLNNWSIEEYTEWFCSLMYKEAKTNEYLGFPYHDIFMEQVVLCGMEGFMEFLEESWLMELMDWQNAYGCYESLGHPSTISKRSSDTIVFGCSDHSTGLGAAALALNFRFILSKQFS